MEKVYQVEEKLESAGAILDGAIAYLQSKCEDDGIHSSLSIMLEEIKNKVVCAIDILYDFGERDTHDERIVRENEELKRYVTEVLKQQLPE